jgi:hypothetical protein
MMSVTNLKKGVSPRCGIKQAARSNTIAQGAPGIESGIGGGGGGVQRSLENFHNNGPNFYFQGINATIRCISVQWWTEVSFEALIGKEK